MSSQNFSTILAPFTFAVFKVVLEVIDSLSLPDYKGSTLRGGLGHALLQTLCQYEYIEERSTDCKNCKHLYDCSYIYLFETRPSPNDSFIKNKKDKVAHPYIIRPSMENKWHYTSGEQITFELILIGKAIEYLPYFAHALVLMGEKGLGKQQKSKPGKVMLKTIESAGVNGPCSFLYQAGDSYLRNPPLSITGADLMAGLSVPQSCTLQLLTRTLLKEKDTFPEVTFDLLFRRLFERIMALSHLHCDIDCRDLESNRLFLFDLARNIKTVSNHLTWEKAQRYSNRQKQRMPFSGWLGSIAFEGDLSPFWPFLLLGEWQHVGKKTSFGFGQYRLVPDDENTI